MKGKITYYEDLLNEIHEETGIDRRELDEALKLSIEYIKECTKNPEVISISLPSLGVLHLNERRARFNKAYRHYKDFEPIVSKQLSIIDKLKKKHKDLVHARNSYLSIFKKFFVKNRADRVSVSKHEIIKKLEIKQNKIK